MESRNDLRLLFISLYLVIFSNAARSPISPVASPSPSQEPFVSYAQFFPSGLPTDSTSAETDSDSPSSGGVQTLGLDSSKIVKLSDKNPQVKGICGSTDYPSLCASTVAPHVKGKITVESVFEAAVTASSDFAKRAHALAAELAEKPGTPPGVSSTFNDCKDGYDTAVENFEKTLSAFSEHDIGTMRSMLSAVITYLGDCEDEIKQTRASSPLSGYAQKLTSMTSNCLAIASLMN